ncbi:UNVERIFIED_CONTAM: hypothetical protein K2H54_023799 [Gekko kuhli]
MTKAEALQRKAMTRPPLIFTCLAGSLLGSSQVSCDIMALACGCKQKGIGQESHGPVTCTGVQFNIPRSSDVHGTMLSPHLIAVGAFLLFLVTFGIDSGEASGNCTVPLLIPIHVIGCQWLH